MKVHIGDTVEFGDAGLGKVIAMTKGWCVGVLDDGREVARPWYRVSIPTEGPNVCHTQEIEHELE